MADVGARNPGPAASLVRYCSYPVLLAGLNFFTPTKSKSGAASFFLTNKAIERVIATSSTKSSRESGVADLFKILVEKPRRPKL